MSINDTSRIVIDDPRVVIQIVASLIDDSRGVIYDCNMFIVQAPWSLFLQGSLTKGGGGLSTFDLLVLASLGQLLFILKLLFTILQNNLPQRGGQLY